MSQTRSSGSVTRTQTVRNADGSVKCFCGDQAIRLQSHSEKNPDRWFFKCPNDSKCKYFKWEDELMNSPASQSRGTQRPAPSSTPTRMGGSQGRTLGSGSSSLSTPSRSSLKRPAAAVVDDDDEDIEALFSEGDEAMMANESPSPLKKFRFAPSAKRDGETSGSRSAGLGSTPVRNQWQVIRDDPENPFHHTAQNLNLTPNSSQHSTASISTPSSTTATPATTTATPSTSDFLSTLSLLPDHLKRLDRKLTAAERSRDAKAKRITELELENAELKRKNGVLEETVEALRARK